MGLGPLVWTYNAEILPEKGLAISVIFGFMSMFIITLFFPVVFAIKDGIVYIFYFFGFICFCGAIYLAKFMKETKDLSLKEIENEFKSNDSRIDSSSIYY